MLKVNSHHTNLFRLSLISRPAVLGTQVCKRTRSRPTGPRGRRMSNFSYFVTSRPATAVLDAVSLCDRQSSPPQNYWIFSRSHSLTFYKDDTQSSAIEVSQQTPYFSVDLHADIQRMLKWAPPESADSTHEEPRQGLLLLTESCMLYLIEPDFQKRRLNFISEVDLHVRRIHSVIIHLHIFFLILLYLIPFLLFHFPPG